MLFGCCSHVLDVRRLSHGRLANTRPAILTSIWFEILLALKGAYAQHHPRSTGTLRPPTTRNRQRSPVSGGTRPRGALSQHRPPHSRWLHKNRIKSMAPPAWQYDFSKMNAAHETSAARLLSFPVQPPRGRCVHLWQWRGRRSARPAHTTFDSPGNRFWDALQRFRQKHVLSPLPTRPGRRSACLGPFHPVCGIRCRRNRGRRSLWESGLSCSLALPCCGERRNAMLDHPVFVGGVLRCGETCGMSVGFIVADVGGIICSRADRSAHETPITMQG